MNRIELTRILSRSVTALFIGAMLAACGGGGNVASTSNTPPNTMSGVAAVGYPIVNGTVRLICAAGVVPAATTNSTGAWQVSAAGLTLPCAVQVSGGTINNVSNTIKYHSLAVSLGTVNITPLTDLIVADFANSPNPDAWFTGLTTATVASASITTASVNTALGNLRTALAELTLLDTIDPITTAFTPTTGNPVDDMLVALKAAMTSTTITHEALLNNMSLPSFTPPTGFGTALTTAFAGTVSGGANPPPPVTGLTATAGDGQVTIRWNAVAGATSYKLYMNTAPGISLTNPANMHHPSVTSPFLHPGLTNGTTYYFVVTAFNKNGESIGSTEVSATPKALPVVTLTATPSSIANGETSHLSWSSTNSTSCISPGGVVAGVIGGFTTPALAATTTYTVTCTGAEGSASRSVTVTVRFSSVADGVNPNGCVRDNVTGLMWEVKTTDGGLRDWNKTYTNYDSTLSAQRFDGLTGSRFYPTQAEIDAPTNSVGFKNSVNAQGLCGFSDWRLPIFEELGGIVEFKFGSVPTIDTTWFPNTQPGYYWSASPVVSSTSFAYDPYSTYSVDFGGGYLGASGSRYYDGRFYRDFSLPVRLVRAGQ